MPVEHDVVRLRRQIEGVHEGQIGTVVYVYENGAFEVEVGDGILITLVEEDIEDVEHEEV